MQYNKKTIEDIDVTGKKILLRCDFNVPKDDEGRITNDKRIVETLPTIKYLLDHGAAIIMCSHLGRPKGQFVPSMSLKPVAVRVEELLGVPVKMSKDVAGEDSKALSKALKPGELMMLENLRFDGREEKNDPEFVKELASLADIYVNDAFGVSHRAHASTAGVASCLPAVCGYLVEKELNVIGGILDNPKRPFLAVLGGSKISDKIEVINKLIDKADVILIGGGMAYTFTKALGGNIGDSINEPDKLNFALEMLEKAEKAGKVFMLPHDTVATERFAADVEYQVVDTKNIGCGHMGMDIGPETINQFKNEIKKAGTIFWNGPMGVFEFPVFAVGTKAIAEAMAESRAITVVGGGDSIAAVEELGYSDRMTHVSTGGGASLDFLVGKPLPGIACLMDK